MDKSEKIILGIVVLAAIAAVAYLATRPAGDMQSGFTAPPEPQQPTRTPGSLGDVGDLFESLARAGTDITRNVLAENRIAADRAAAASAAAARQRSGAPRT